MVNPDKLFGRLGNRLFQMAFCYAESRKNGTDYYFQDPMYFEEYEEEIKSLFGTNIVPINQVAIHVRRGDYVDNPFYVDLTQTGYYDRAINYFHKEKFLVFSDDIKWCKKFFKGKQFEFSEGNDEITDLNLMAGCKGIIMANSSFSWWAAYLSKGQVVAPIEWYADGVDRTICPPHWVKL